MKVQRAVITGMGAVTPLGSSVDLFWNGLINGVSGVRKITQFDASDLPCQIAGEIPDFDPVAISRSKGSPAVAAFSSDCSGFSHPGSK